MINKRLLLCGMALLAGMPILVNGVVSVNLSQSIAGYHSVFYIGQAVVCLGLLYASVTSLDSPGSLFQ